MHVKVEQILVLVKGIKVQDIFE